MAGRTGFDDKLIARIAEGDRRAFAEVYEATKSTVYGYALSFVKNREDAEDIMHDVYLKLYRSAGQYKPRGKPLAFLLTIVRNTALNRLRSRGRESALPQEEVVRQQDTAAYSDPAGQSEDRILLETALHILDDTERQIVILHAVSEMKHREIAEILGLKLPTVLSKYRRALDKMKNELERKGVRL